MCNNTQLSDNQTANYLYFSLEEGKAHITEDLPKDHSWLWRHDFKNCANNHLGREDHKMKLEDYITDKFLVTIDGVLVPHYSSLQTHQVGLYQNSEFLILSTQSRRIFSFYLLDGNIPDVIKDNLSDDKFIQKYINANAEQLYSNQPSKVKSLRTFDIMPKHSHTDSTYNYHIYELSDLLDEKQLYYVEVACRHHNRIYYAFRNKNIARRFVMDYSSWSFIFCNNRLTE